MRQNQLEIDSSKAALEAIKISKEYLNILIDTTGVTINKDAADTKIDKIDIKPYITAIKPYITALTSKSITLHDNEYNKPLIQILHALYLLKLRTGFRDNKGKDIPEDKRKTVANIIRAEINPTIEKINVQLMAVLELWQGEVKRVKEDHKYDIEVLNANNSGNGSGNGNGNGNGNEHVNSNVE